MAGPIEIGVRTDASQSRRELSTVDRSFRSLGRSAARYGAAAARGLATTAAAAGVLGAKLAKNAADDQRSATVLATALRNRADATDRDIGAVERWIAAQGRAFGVADDELRPALAQLATATGDVGKAQRLTSVAMDVAAGRGVKLGAVTKALEKAANGSVGGLSRLGIQTKDAEGKTKSLEAITRDLARTYRGQAANSAATVAGQYQRLKVFITETGEGIGYTLLPAASRLADFIQSRGVPTVQSYWRTFERNGIDGVVRQLDRAVGANGRVEAVAGEVERSLRAVWRIVGEVGGAMVDAGEDVPAILSPLKSLDTLLGGVASGLEAIPDPVKSLGVQAGIAALVVPRLTAAVSSATGAVGTNIAALRVWRAEMAATETRSATLAATVTRLGGAARAAAGVAGMVGLTQAMAATNAQSSTTERGLGALGTVASATALGFSVGGPWGAAAGVIGGVGLATYDLASAHYDAKEAARQQERAEYAAKAAMQEGRNTAADYRDTLDQLTNAVTRSTRERIIANAQESGALSLAQRLGITGRDLIGTVLGQEGATRRLTRTMRENAAALTGPEQTQLSAWLRRNSGEFARQQRDAVEAGRAIKTWREATRGLPPKLVSELKLLGADISIGELRRLRRQYDLNPKQVRTVVEAVGTELTIRKVRGVFKLFRDGAPVSANLEPWLTDLARGLGKGRTRTQRDVGNIDELLGGAGAPANMGPFTSSIATGVSAGRTIARSQSPSVGAALSEGVAAGVRARAAAIAAEARSAVAAAVTAGQAAARSKSPSRETFEKVGVPLADGVTAGLKAGTPRAQRTARSLVATVIGAAQRGATDAIRDRITRLVESSVNLDNAQAEDRREAAVLRGLRARFKLLEQNARAQERVNRQLDAARDKHRQLVDAARQYAAGIKATVVSFGSVVGLGVVEDGAPAGTVSLANMLEQLRERAAKAERFNQLIRQLAKDKLNRTTIQQLLDAGPEASLATAEAIARGGDAAVNEINRLTANIADSGRELGNSLATRYHAAGIQAAAGVVAGLEAESRQLDRAAAKLARALVAAVRRELGIRSPSRSFRTIGEQTMTGLELGLEDTRARRAGARLAAGVKAGYGRPQLADVRGGSAGADGVIPIQITLKGEAQSQLRAGRSVTVDVDVARSAGVRQLAVGGAR